MIHPRPHGDVAIFVGNNQSNAPLEVSTKNFHFPKMSLSFPFLVNSSPPPHARFLYQLSWHLAKIPVHLPVESFSKF